VKETLESLEVAASLDPLKIVLHPSYITGSACLVVDKAKKLRWKAFHKSWTKPTSFGLSFCIENMFPVQLSGAPQDFLKIFDKFPYLNLPWIQDTLISAAQVISEILNFWKNFAIALRTFMQATLWQGDNHLPIGAGTIDFQKIVRGLIAIGYDDT